ncbi:MAG TPA: ANTAR domain-containing protein [Bryobacteraceae bacterium]|nr:ANTAR domain-containing protein [Bryobacteraceae bacterium]
MTEQDVLFRISEIVNGRQDFLHAMEQIALLLERAFGGKGVFLDHAPDAFQRLESLPQPYRSLYTVDLRDAGRSLGKLTLLFASGSFQGDAPRRIADFVGEQLGMLLARLRLAGRTAELKQEISAMERDLAERKLIQRAEGLLVARRGMTASAAHAWISTQSKNMGLSKAGVADRIIAYHQASALMPQKIA